MDFQKKPISSYPKKLQRDIHLLRVDRQGEIIIMGTTTFRSSLYASDLDLIENIFKKGKDRLIAFFQRNIQRVVRQIVEAKDHYFLELKCGLDERYHFDLKSPNLSREIASHRKLFDPTELKVLLGDSSFEEKKSIIRKHYVLRWNPEEIKLGYKVLTGGVQFTLAEGMSQKSYLNLEIISNVNGRLLEESNFFYLGYYDEQGQLILLNMPQDYIDHQFDYFRQVLCQSMIEVIESKTDYNPLKYAKRIFSYARLTENYRLVKQVKPLLNSVYGLMYQTKSEISTIIKLLTSTQTKPIPIRVIKNQIQNIKFKLGNFLEIHPPLLEQLNEKIDQLDRIKFDSPAIIKCLNEIKHPLSEIVNRKATEYLENVRLLPIPRIFRREAERSFSLHH